MSFSTMLLSRSPIKMEMMLMELRKTTACLWVKLVLSYPNWLKIIWMSQRTTILLPLAPKTALVCPTNIYHRSWPSRIQKAPPSLRSRKETDWADTTGEAGHGANDTEWIVAFVPCCIIYCILAFVICHFFFNIYVNKVGTTVGNFYVMGF